MTAQSIEQTLKAGYAGARQRLGVVGVTVNRLAEVQREVAKRHREAKAAIEHQKARAQAEIEAEKVFQENIKIIDVSALVMSGIAHGAFMQMGVSSIDLPKLTMAQIAEQVLRAHPGITLSDVRGESRIRPVMLARRHIIISIKQHRPEISNCAVGRFVNKDHSSIFHALRKGRKRAE